MKELKFRIWNGMEMICDVTPFTNKYADGTPVMQFTGLHDKEGKEIYKGDIIVSNGGDVMLVGWREDLASFVLQKQGWAYDHYFGEAVDAGNTKIIGNIHQNPEILKP